MSTFDYCLVNYRCVPAVLDTISWVRSCSSWKGNFHVVDNSGDMPELREADVHVHRPGQNLGYLGGLLLAMRESTGDGWFVASNPDVRVGPSFFFQLLQLDAENAVVAPRIIDKDGRDQNPFMHRRPSMMALVGRYVVFGIPALKRLYIRIRPARATADSAVASPIYAPHGACFAVSPGARHQLADVEPYAFLYAEELTVGEEAMRRAISVRYEPSIVIRHLGGMTTTPLPMRTISQLQRQALAGYVRSRIKQTRDS